MKKQYNEKLFQAFQANLLSLISHELRTPLTGVINSVNLLRESGHPPELTQEFITMAFRNVHKLNQSLSAILDVASIESGSFVVRLKEVKPKRILKRRLEVQQALLEEQGIRCHYDPLLLKDNQEDSVILADPSKLSRVIDLSFQVITDWVSEHKKLHISLDSQVMKFQFSFNQEQEADFMNTWKILEDSKKLADSFSLIAFSSTLQTQEGFLTRTREGLGSELILINYIMQLHKGEFNYNIEAETMTLELKFPNLSSLLAVREVISSRVYDATEGVKSLAIAIIQVPKNMSLGIYRDKVKMALFRSADAAYSISENHTIALILDDCKKEDVPFLLKRISTNTGDDCKIASVSCPEDGTDPDYLMELALKKLNS